MNNRVLGRDGMILTGENLKYWETLPQCQFINHKSHKDRSWAETGPSPWEVGE